MTSHKGSLSALRRVALWLIGILCACVILVIVLVFVNRPQRSIPDTSCWQTGDIFFSVGDSWKSVTVRSLSGMREFGVADSIPSHCGVVVISADGPLLVHASTSAKRIVAETPGQYMENNGSYCLYAMKAPCTLDTLRLRADVDSLLTHRVPFDFNFDHSDSTALYCTEMVIELLELNSCFEASALRQQNYIYPQDLAKKCRKKPQ